MRTRLTIGVVGSGGDGVVMLGSYLQKVAAKQGYFSQMPRYYGAQIRGGGSAVKLGLDAERLSLPKDNPDILVCFNWEKYFEFELELPLGADTVVLQESDSSRENILLGEYFRVDFSKISQEVTGSSRNKNMVALGLLMGILAISNDGGGKADYQGLRMSKHHLLALEAGLDLFGQLSFPDLRLSPAEDRADKVVLHGNAVIARAAISAGCRAFFGYPITPASEIMEEMQQGLSQRGGVFLQAEDEISSAALALGASLTGVQPMSSTSGPGFDLMTESMVLASAAEIPMVIVDVQRCGPSTGIPSKTEQSDLNHAIYGGHGDASRVVIAPYDIEGCYRLVMESFDIAQYFQTPVILLSDQWLGQTLVATEYEFLTKDYPIRERKRPTGRDLGDYHRYQLTDDFISPMADVGSEGLAYRTTGLTHDESGEPAFDFKTHQWLHEKTWQKLRPLRKRDDLAVVFGKEGSNKGIIAWGSSAQVVLETVKDLGLQDEVKVCVPELIHPLPERIERFLKSTERLLVVEMNYTGQLHRYLRSQSELPEQTYTYTRPGGRPFSMKELAEPIAEITR